MMIVCSTLYGKRRLVAKGDLSVRRSAYAVILECEQLLLVRLGRTGKYWFPGGAIEECETLDAALMREVHEETGITVAIGEVLTEVENYWYDDTCDGGIPRHRYIRPLSSAHCRAVRGGESRFRMGISRVGRSGQAHTR